MQNDFLPEVHGFERIQGDCIQIMREMPKDSIDCIMSDPPWAMPASYYPTSMGTTGMRAWSDTGIMSDWWEIVCAAMFPLLKNTGCIFVFCDSVSSAVFIPHIYRHTTNLQFLVWDKMSPALGSNFRRQHELIIFGTRRGGWGGKIPKVPTRNGYMGDIIKCKRVPPSRRKHPAQKPHDLLVTLLKQAVMPGATVLDPFAGSCTTGHAAAACGMKGICIEQDIDIPVA